MTDQSFYSDRLHGPQERTLDQLPDHTRRGLLGLLTNKVNSNWFAHTFPLQCPDGNGIAGTDEDALASNVSALVPDAEWPRWNANNARRDEVIFDLIEWAAQRIEQPEEFRWHNYYRHHELDFDRPKGLSTFRQEANQMLQRGRVMYHVAESGRVERLGTVEVQKIMEVLHPDTGDATLDRLLTEARTGYAAHQHPARRHALERLWDGFERLKTLELPGGDKKASVEALLNQIADSEWRAVINLEMVSMTKMGNEFDIRHYETRVKSIPPEAEDYLFARMGSLIVYLLGVSNRLKGVDEEVADDSFWA